MKRYLGFIIVLLCSTMARADFNNAISLAQQAGAISGAASSCGQDISLLSSHLQDAFNVMVSNEEQRAKVMITYLQAFNNAKEMEAAKAKIPCDQVLKDYNNLPILKPDYQNTVLPGLRDTATAVQPVPSMTSPALQPQQPNTSVTVPSIPALATPSTAPAQDMTVPVTPSGSSPALAIPAAPTNPLAPPQPSVPANNPVVPGANAVVPTQPGPVAPQPGSPY